MKWVLLILTILYIIGDFVKDSAEMAVTAAVFLVGYLVLDKLDKIHDET